MQERFSQELWEYLALQKGVKFWHRAVMHFDRGEGVAKKKSSSI